MSSKYNNASLRDLINYCNNAYDLTMVIKRNDNGIYQVLQEEKHDNENVNGQVYVKAYKKITYISYITLENIDVILDKLFLNTDPKFTSDGLSRFLDLQFKANNNFRDDTYIRIKDYIRDSGYEIKNMQYKLWYSKYM